MQCVWEVKKIMFTYNRKINICVIWIIGEKRATIMIPNITVNKIITSDWYKMYEFNLNNVFCSHDQSSNAVWKTRLSWLRPCSSHFQISSLRFVVELHNLFWEHRVQLLCCQLLAARRVLLSQNSANGERTTHIITSVRKNIQN